MLYLVTLLFLPFTLANLECAKEADPCESDSDCGKDDKCGPSVCYDYGFMKGCAYCQSMGIEDDCKGMAGCTWFANDQGEKCFHSGGEKEAPKCKGEAETCTDDSECCPSKNGKEKGTCFDYGFGKGCVTCASHMDQGDCESMGCTWQDDKCYYSMPEKECEGEMMMMGGKKMCCPADRTEWNGDFSKAMKCCKAPITRMDGKCSEEEPEKGDCEMEGMCCPENYECRMNRGATKKACVADNDAEIMAVKCGNPCKGMMSMMDEKCMRAKNKEECVKMTASPMSTKPICKYEDAKDDDEGKDGGKMCCKAMIASCMACAKDMTVEEFCEAADNKEVKGCDKDDGGEMEKGDCEMEGMCCPDNYTCKMAGGGANKKACVAENGAEIMAVKCGNPCKGNMGMWDEKCMRAESKEECEKMTASPMSTKPICVFKDGGDKDGDDGKEGFMPPKDCECVATEDKEGYKWPAKCSVKPGGKTSICYVDRSGEKPCADSKLSTKSTFKYVVCGDGKPKEEECEGEMMMMDGKKMCCPAERTEWNGDFSKAMKCCKEPITRMDGKCSEEEPAVEVCKQEMKTGPCRMAMQKYYFDGQRCQQFMYGGCQGNDNNFATMKACEAKCGGDMEISYFTSFDEFKTLAMLSSDEKTCQMFQGRWNKKKSKCAAPKNKNKVKCKKFKDANMCKRTGCTYSKKKAKCAKKPNNLK